MVAEGDQVRWAEETGPKGEGEVILVKTNPLGKQEAYIKLPDGSMVSKLVDDLSVTSDD